MNKMSLVQYMLILSMCTFAIVRCNEEVPTEQEEDVAHEAPRYVITNEVFMDIEIRSSKNSEPIKSGRIVIGLFGDVCPMTATNFLQLAKGFKRDNVITNF